MTGLFGHFFPYFGSCSSRPAIQFFKNWKKNNLFVVHVLCFQSFLVYVVILPLPYIYNFLWNYVFIFYFHFDLPIHSLEKFLNLFKKYGLIVKKYMYYRVIKYTCLVTLVHLYINFAIDLQKSANHCVGRMSCNQMSIMYVVYNIVNRSFN